MFKIFSSHSNEVPGVSQMPKQEVQKTNKEIEIDLIKYSLMTNPDNNFPIETIERMAAEEYNRKHQS